MSLEQEFQQFRIEMTDRLARIETKVESLRKNNGNTNSGNKPLSQAIEAIKLLATAVAAVAAAKLF